MSLARTKSWEPALTPREAAAITIPKDEYESAVLYARLTAEEHLELGTPRGLWEPTALQNDHLAAPFITDGEQELASRLEKEADSPLDEAQGFIENAKADLDEIVEHARPIAASESGVSYSVAEAVRQVGEHDEKIQQDEADGKHHHRRISALLQRIATFAPWVEALGFFTFITYYLNVPLLEPWQDWLGWSFGVTVVVVIIIGQTWLVRHAARDHNHAREVQSNGLRHEAYRGITRRNRYLGLTAVTALAVTIGMIWRGTAALGNASIGTTVVMVFIAIVTGLLLPTLAYLGIALDGSQVSRERDSLAADLDEDLEAYLDTVSNSRRDLAQAAEIGDKLRDKIFPDICNATQEIVDGVYGLYGTVRLLIGSLSADPPAKTTKTISRDAAGNISGYIGTSIPGTGRVNLGPLLDRQHRLEEIQARQTGLLSRIDALPPHPWGKPRT
jgi:hypothetical protein